MTLHFINLFDGCFGPDINYPFTLHVSEKTSVHQPAADGVIPAGATTSSKIVNTALHSKTKV